MFQVPYSVSTDDIGRMFKRFGDDVALPDQRVLPQRVHVSFHKQKETIAKGKITHGFFSSIVPYGYSYRKNIWYSIY